MQMKSTRFLSSNRWIHWKIWKFDFAEFFDGFFFLEKSKRDKISINKIFIIMSNFESISNFEPNSCQMHHVKAGQLNTKSNLIAQNQFKISATIQFE